MDLDSPAIPLLVKHHGLAFSPWCFTGDRRSITGDP
jgi:hypothetical protein